MNDLKLVEILQFLLPCNYHFNLLSALLQQSKLIELLGEHGVVGKLPRPFAQVAINAGRDEIENVCAASFDHRLYMVAVKDDVRGTLAAVLTRKRIALE